MAQVADDLGVGKSTLRKWKHDINEADLLAGPHDDVEKELARLRRENELRRQERDLLKNQQPSLPGRRSRLRQRVETVFKTIKSELIWRSGYASRRQAEIAIGQYIDGFYNPRRRHFAIGYKSPIAFEAEMANLE